MTDDHEHMVECHGCGRLYDVRDVAVSNEHGVQHLHGHITASKLQIERDVWARTAIMERALGTQRRHQNA